MLLKKPGTRFTKLVYKFVDVLGFGDHCKPVYILELSHIYLEEFDPSTPRCPRIRSRTDGQTFRLSRGEAPLRRSIVDLLSVPCSNVPWILGSILKYRGHLQINSPRKKEGIRMKTEQSELTRGRLNWKWLFYKSTEAGRCSSERGIHGSV
jgi:hypothetical protein